LPEYGGAKESHTVAPRLGVFTLIPLEQTPSGNGTRKVQRGTA
jgi:hypothetical protein